MRRPTANAAVMVPVALASLAFAGAGPRARQVAASADTRPRFDAATLKPCTPNAPGSGRSGGAGTALPGRLRIECQPFFSLMRMAYQLYADGRANAPGTYPTLE